MATKLAEAFVRIFATDRDMDTGLAKSKSKLTQWAAGVQGIYKTAAAGIGTIIGATAFQRAISAQLSYMNEASRLARIQADAERKLEATIKATGGAVGYTADELKQYAARLQIATGVGDEAIIDSMSKLTTFKSIAGTVFKRTTKAALDLSATGFGTLDSTIVMLGKAIEDPIRGLTALRRVGVSFTKAQEDTIKKLAEANKLYEAQGLILEAVEGQVKGVAEAMSKTLGGQIDILKGKISDLKEVSGTAGMEMEKQWLETSLGFHQALADMTKASDTFGKSVGSQLGKTFAFAFRDNAQAEMPNIFRTIFDPTYLYNYLRGGLTKPFEDQLEVAEKAGDELDKKLEMMQRKRLDNEEKAKEKEDRPELARLEDLWRKVQFAQLGEGAAKLGAGIQQLGNMNQTAAANADMAMSLQRGEGLWARQLDALERIAGKDPVNLQMASA